MAVIESSSFSITPVNNTRPCTTSILIFVYKSRKFFFINSPFIEVEILTSVIVSPAGRSLANSRTVPAVPANIVSKQPDSITDIHMMVTIFI